MLDAQWTWATNSIAQVISLSHILTSRLVGWLQFLTSLAARLASLFLYQSHQISFNFLRQSFSFNLYTLCGDKQCKVHMYSHHAPPVYFPPLHISEKIELENCGVTSRWHAFIHRDLIHANYNIYLQQKG